MPAKVQLRELTAEEREAVARLAHSRTDEARLRQRARVIDRLADGEPPGRVAAAVGLSRNQLYQWLHRFNAEGLAGLRDRPREGRPPTYSPEQVAEVVAAALTAPKDLGLDYACWTLD